jgi:hypothetical protein
MAPCSLSACQVVRVFCAALRALGASPIMPPKIYIVFLQGTQAIKLLCNASTYKRLPLSLSSLVCGFAKNIWCARPPSPLLFGATSPQRFFLAPKNHKKDSQDDALALPAIMAINNPKQSHNMVCRAESNGAVSGPLFQRLETYYSGSSGRIFRQSTAQHSSGIE